MTKYLLLFATSTLLSPAQTVIPNGAPASHVFDGRIDEWKTLDPTFVLRSTTGGRKALVWVRQIPEGLLIAGEVLGDAPDFPNDESEMLQKDHVEIWLAPENPPKFPPIGWVNYEGHVTIEKRQDCIDYVKKRAPGNEASCDSWLAQVARDRPRVARLFARQFGLSPYVAVEAFAQPAWEALNREGEWSRLEPKQMPSFKAEPFDGGYSFESVISWEAMPPFTSLDWKSMRLMVDVFSAHKGAPKNQPFSTSSAVRRYGDMATLNLVKLVTGRKFRVTECEYPLEELELEDESKMPAFFRPTATDDVLEVMTLRRSFGSRMAWIPEGQSPSQQAFDYWQRPLAVGSATVTACGPRLRVRDKNRIRRLDVEGDKDALTTLEQPDGGYLVMSGPTVRPSRTKSFDPCFQCKVVELTITGLSPRGETRTLLELNEATGIDAVALLDRDIQVSRDWSKVTIYRETNHEPPEWESETLCRRGAEYKSCGKNPHSGPPPLPRVVQPLEHQ